VLDGASYEVAGVMPAGFAYPSWAELWRPLRSTDRAAQGRGNRNFLVFGRLQSDVTLERAESELVTIAGGIAEQYPDVNEGWSVTLVGLQDLSVGGVRGVLWLLLGAVGLVLLIACANVAALLLSRAAGRQGEMAVRVALGASRRRLEAQLLTESVLTALLGGLLGLGVAQGALMALRSLGGGSLPRLATVELDGTALLFMLVLSVATGLLFGLVPALKAPQLQLAETLKERPRGGGGAGGMRLQSALVVGQVALSLMLLVGSGLLIRSFLRLQNEELGFQPENVLTARLQLPRATYGPERPPQLFYEAALGRVAALPGVEAVGTITQLPVSGGFGPWNYVHAESHPPATPADRRGGVRRIVSADYFEAMGIPLLRGRTFERTDVADAPSVAVISQRMADEFFPDEDPLGRSIVLPWDPPVHLQVVGVVGDVRLGSLQSDTRSTMYWPLTQAPGLTTYLVVRTRDDAATLGPMLRGAIGEIDSDVPIADLVPMATVVSSSMAQTRFRTILLGTFAGLALFLAALGLYGVLAQLVGRRTHELGVRMALGADGWCLMRSVLRQGMKLAGIGLVLGLVGAIAATRLAESMLYEVEPLDLTTFVVTSLCLALVALVAGALPAWRATRVDPVESLRAE
jgi:putative ABC transport system permease protein